MKSGFRVMVLFVLAALLGAACSGDSAADGTAGEPTSASAGGAEDATSASADEDPQPSVARDDEAGTPVPIAAGEPGSPILENSSWPVVPVDVKPSEYDEALCRRLETFADVFDAAANPYESTVIAAAAALAAPEANDEVGAFFGEVQVWLERLAASRAEYESLSDDEQFEVSEEFWDREQDFEDPLELHDRAGIAARTRLACELRLPDRVATESNVRGWQPDEVPAPVTYPIADTASVSPNLLLTDIVATIVWADDSGFESTVPGDYSSLRPSSEPIVVVDMTVGNPGSIVRRDFEVGDLRLRLRDGGIVKLSDRSPDRRSSVEPEPGTSQRVVLVGELTHARWDQRRIRLPDLDGAALIVGEKVTPAVLGFDGTVWGANAVDDRMLEVAGPILIESPNFRDCTPTLQVEVQSARIGPDAATLVAPEALPDASGALYERAYPGQRVVAFEFLLQNVTTDGDCDWLFGFGQSDWQLLSDGEPINSDKHTMPEVELAPGESAQVTAWAEVTVGAAEFELAFTGSDDVFDDRDGRVRVPLELPELVLAPGEAELINRP